MQAIAEAVGQDRVARVVHRFYAQVRVHPRLKVPFERVHDWPGHEALISHFWWVSLGGERYLDYSYAVARKHMAAGFTPALLADWLALFQQTVEAELPPELARGWLARAQNIGESLTHMHAIHSKGSEMDTSLFRPA